MPQPLPSKEGSLFKQVLKAYETKQYKKGLKTCDVASPNLCPPSVHSNAA